MNIRKGSALVWVGAALTAGMILLSAVGSWVAPYDPALQLAGEPLAGPSAQHLLGTDRYGRDVFSRVLHGGHLTLLFTALALLGVVAAGTVLGALAAVAKPAVDRLATNIFDLLVAFPAVIVALAFAGIYCPSLGVARALARDHRHRPRRAACGGAGGR